MTYLEDELGRDLKHLIKHSSDTEWTESRDQDTMCDSPIGLVSMCGEQTCLISTRQLE
jgi:hypothetical protein